MTATIVYDKSIYDVNSVDSSGRYGFKVQEDSAAESDEATPDDEETEGAGSEGTGSEGAVED